MQIKVEITQMKTINQINNKISLREARELIISVGGNMSIAEKIASNNHKTLADYIESQEWKIEVLENENERLTNFNGNTQVLQAYS